LRRLIDAAQPRLRGVATGIAGSLLAWVVAARVLSHGLPPGVVLRGLVFGLLYALTAMGIILIYRANRVINLAQASLGSVAAVVAIEFVLHGLPYLIAVPLGLVIAALIGAVIERFIVRRFRNAPRLIVMVATIGLAQVLFGLSVLIPIAWEGELKARPFETPFKTSFFVRPELFRGDHVMVLILVPIVMAAVGAFLRFTDYGIGIRAAAENSSRAHLLGIPVFRLSTVVWSMAAVLSALTAIMRVPLVGFASFNDVSGAGNALLLRTLAAAVIARMENLPRAAMAAIAIGVFENAAVWNLPRTTVVDAMLVVVILVALLVQRDFFSRVSETGISSWRAIREVRPIPEELRHLPEVRFGLRGLSVLVLVMAAALPLWANTSQEEAASLVLIYAIVAISLLVLTGWAGHISLGQWAFAGFGGATTSVLYGRHGWDIFAAVIAGVVVASLVALLVGLPALRIRGPFLAVTTLAFAVTAQTYFLEDRYFPWFIQSRISRPYLFNRLSLQEPWQMYLVCLVSLLAVGAGAGALRRSHTGRVLIAVRDNEVAAEAAAINTTRVKLTAFVISGAIAGFAGALYVVHENGLNTDAFNANVSLLLFSMVVIGGLGSLPGVVLGAAYVRGVQFFLPPEWALLASGAGILLLLLFLPEGLGGLLFGGRDAFLRWVARRRGILVPSLLADRRVEQEEESQARVAIDTALGGLAAASASAAPANGGTEPSTARVDAGAAP
jgi:branched-chain amino acid transport system permease protein